ncbi:hypothetical protein JCM11251_006747 [Rhodosporidiobolus azoricus]
MGWTRGLFVTQAPPAPPLEVLKFKPSSEVSHIEHAEIAEPAEPERRALPRVANPETLWLASGGRDPVDEDDLPVFTAEEVALHNNPTDGLWIIVEDRVYDCTQFAELHPGGPEVFTQFGGKQCTWQFWKWHSKKHLTAWSSALLIGRVDVIPPNPYPQPRRWVKTGKI